MNILVINCGSSSLKYQLIDMREEKLIFKGNIDRIGAGQKVPDHSSAIRQAFEELIREKALTSLQEIDAVGHRVVHGGEKFSAPLLVDEAALPELESLNDLAPLHNPPNLAGIRECIAMLSGAPQVAVFDTAFHQSMPEKEYIYAIPYRYYKEYGVRKYGFHGTSHKYVSQQVTRLLKGDNLKIISCHLGNGSSITAIKDGQSIATTMGFTPLAGIVMGTRCGDLDPAVIPYIMEKETIPPEEINQILNRESGLLGISGLSSDLRDLEAAASGGNKSAALAIDILVWSVKKNIGAMAAILGGLDVLVFTGGIGENSADIRARILQDLDFLGLRLDPDKNFAKAHRQINSVEYPVKILVIPANEELMIARETAGVVQKNLVGVR